MADLNQDFNPNDVPEDDRSFEPLAAGDYQMQVIESEIKPTKTGGDQLVLTIEVIDGPMSNRRVWDRLNIRNQNPDAQRIAQRSLADLCLAVGVPSLRNSEDLHFKPFVGKVTIKPDKSGQYGPSNSVRYKARGGVAPATNKVADNPSTARQTQNGGAALAGRAAQGAKPWQRPAA